MRLVNWDPRGIVRATLETTSSNWTLPQGLVSKLPARAAPVGPALQGKGQVERTVNGFHAKLGVWLYILHILHIAEVALLSLSLRMRWDFGFLIVGICSHVHFRHQYRLPEVREDSLSARLLALAL